jgi:hypothetical protein
MPLSGIEAEVARLSALLCREIALATGLRREFDHSALRYESSFHFSITLLAPGLRQAFEATGRQNGGATSGSSLT